MQFYFITQAVAILYGTLCVRGLAYYGTEGERFESFGVYFRKIVAATTCGKGPPSKYANSLLAEPGLSWHSHAQFAVSAPTKWRHASAPTRPGGRWALQPTHLSGPVRFPKALHGTTNRMSNMKSSIFGRQLIKLPVTGGRQFVVEPR